MISTLQRDHQLALLSEFAEPLEPIEELYPDCLMLRQLLSFEEQQELVASCRQWCAHGFHTPSMPDGSKLNHPICGLGFDWVPYEYLPAKRPFPDELQTLANRALIEANERLSQDYRPFNPDTALINYFPPKSSLGSHVDRSEDESLRKAGSPIITAALGDDCILTVGGFRRTTKSKKVTMRSGDVFLMCGPSRMRFHGVPKIEPRTAPIGLDMKPGRISITIRQARRAA